MIRIQRLLALLLCLLAAGGCLFDDDDEDPPTAPDDTLVSSTQPGLMSNFATTYEAGRIDHYEQLLHDDFEFFLEGTSAGSLTRAEELETFEKMSTGVSGVGGIAFEDVLVLGMTAHEAWSPVPDTDQYFGDYEGTASLCPYLVALDFNVTGMPLTYQVRGPVIFYAVEVDEGFQLLGMVDQTADDKATEAHSWSSIRLLFH